MSENWRSLAGAAIGIAASIVTAGILAPAGLAFLSIWGATAAGAVGSFAGGFSGTLLNGGNLGQAFTAGVVGGIIGGASGFLSFAAGAIKGSTISNILERMGRHAFVNAWLTGVQGQNMWSAALTGGASSLGGAGVMALKIENIGLLSAANATIGGTVSVIGGGKFANGAVTGAYTMLFNELVHGDKHKNFVNENFKDRLPDNAQIVWQVWDGGVGETSTDYLYDESATLTVKIPKSFLSNRRLLYDCIDHEIVHINDYASGRSWDWFKQYGESYKAIMDYRAYSRNQWYNKNTNGTSNYDSSVNKYKVQLPKGFSKGLTFN